MCLVNLHQTFKENRQEDLLPWIEELRKEPVLDTPCYNSSSNNSVAVCNRPSLMEGRRSTAGSGSTRLTWLPPLRFQLPPTPEEKQEDLIPLTSSSHPPLRRSQTCTSSIYSQNTTGSNTTDLRRPSTLSSLSSRSSSKRIVNPHLKESRSVQKTLTPKSATTLRRSRTLNDGSYPIRPGTKPSMPPAEFWKYTEKQHMRLNSLGHSSTFRTWSTPRIAKPFMRREPSLCRYPILPLPPQPVCRTRRATVHSETAHIKSASYESIRKGSLLTFDSVNDLCHMIHKDTQLERAGTDRRSNGQRRSQRQSRTLTKKRQPDDI